MDLTGPSVTKKCKICGEQKDISEFHKNGSWTRPECAACNRERQKNYHALRRQQKTPELGTPCECCGRTDEKLCWDHCHNTQEHRGWLCSNCNTGIGKLGDNISGVQQALDYLESMSNLEDTNIKGDHDFKEEEREGPTAKGQSD